MSEERTNIGQSLRRLPLRAYWDLLRRRIWPDRRLLLVLGVVMFVGLIVRLVAPWLVGRFVDEVKELSGTESTALTGGLVVLAGSFFLAGLLDQALRVVSRNLGEYLAWRATNRLREDLLNHSLQLDMSFHHANGPGVMVERIDGDVRQLNNFFTEFGLSIVTNLLVMEFPQFLGKPVQRPGRGVKPLWLFVRTSGPEQRHAARSSWVVVRR